MGRARGTAKNRGKPVEGRGAWPPELLDLQRRGGMSPDWHDTWHERGQGVGAPSRSAPKPLFEALAGLQNLSDSYQKILDEPSFHELLPRESCRSFAAIFDRTYSLAEEKGRRELRSFLDGIPYKRPLEDISRDIRIASIDRAHNLLEGMQVTSADIVEAGRVQGLLQRAAEEFQVGIMSTELRSDIEKALRELKTSDILPPKSKVLLGDALMAALHLGFSNFQSNGRINYYNSSLLHLIRLEQILGSGEEPISLPYWEIWKKACSAS